MRYYLTLASKLLFISSLFITSSSWAKTSELWTQFEKAKKSGTESTLPDFSYAGYDYSESLLPDISDWPVFNVTTFGAIANDDKYDDDAIIKTIAAAQKAERGVVFFPKGTYKVSPKSSLDGQIFITKSNVVLKGSGSGDDGTIIFMDKMKKNHKIHMFHVAPKIEKSASITYLTKNVKRESFEIEVANADKLNVGQRIVLKAKSVALAKQYYAPKKITRAWTRLLKEGFKLHEIHTIKSIRGNIIRLREPLHISLDVSLSKIKIYPITLLNNIGIEDIQFRGNWDSYPEEFVHHKDELHDYAWNALRLENVENSWIKHCEFKHWNQGIFIKNSAAMTISDIVFSGKKAHMSIHTRSSYGILVKDSEDKQGNHHGPSVGYSNVGTVYLRYKMKDEQHMDSHSGSPYATLFDNVSNGNFEKNGGPHKGYPHHGKYYVAWNYLLKGGPKKYDFWRKKRNGHTIFMPYFIGLHGKEVSMKYGTYAINEHPGEKVEPASLFEAQLALRLSLNK